MTELTPLFDQESYCEKVEQVKHYIHEGDIFQLVLANRLEAGFNGSLLDTYRILRTKNPSPYMFYFSSNDLEIAGDTGKGGQDPGERTKRRIYCIFDSGRKQKFRWYL